MVDLEFTARAKHFIPLTLFRHIASLATDEPPTEVGYIGEDGIRAIKSMHTHPYRLPRNIDTRF